MSQRGSRRRGRHRSTPSHRQARGRGPPARHPPAAQPHRPPANPRKRTRSNSPSPDEPSTKRRRLDARLPAHPPPPLPTAFSWTSSCSIGPIPPSSVGADEEEESTTALLSFSPLIQERELPDAEGYVGFADGLVTYESSERYSSQRVIPHFLTLLDTRYSIHVLRWLTFPDTDLSLLFVGTRPMGLDVRLLTPPEATRSSSPILLYSVTSSLECVFIGMVTFDVSHVFAYDFFPVLLPTLPSQPSLISVVSCLSDGYLSVSVLPDLRSLLGSAPRVFSFPDLPNRTLFRIDSLDVFLTHTTLTAVCWTPDLRHVIAGSMDGRFHIFAVCRHNDLKRLIYSVTSTGHFPFRENMIAATIRQIAPCGVNPNMFATTSHDGSVHVWDRRDPMIPCVCHRLGQSWVNGVVFPRGSSEFITVTMLGQICQFVVLDESRSRSKAKMVNFKTVLNAGEGLWCVDASRSQMVCCSDSGSLFLFRLGNGGEIVMSGGQKKRVEAREADMLDSIVMRSFKGVDGSNILVFRSKVGMEPVGVRVLKESDGEETVRLQVDETPRPETESVALMACRVREISNRGGIVATAGNSGIITLLRMES